MEDKGYVNIRFIIFLKATLGKMVATEILGNDFLDLHFWQQWPKKFYNIKAYDSAKNDVVKQTKVVIPMEGEAGPKDIDQWYEEAQYQENVDSTSILVFLNFF